ncbi:fungal specific transcription factor domain-containing protein [Diplodia corticola]|uniref:Fungal specific transcription factor domain-containing protein n=1 Tax=Diplodia corticola TaxID=236234 RepID=A0A1J9QPM9_9PEZI|nr:fungal specific transcription factor domain-containing protein [Diplodia corticola]OJD30417.1 fungal specific transcription factor domain-containing protein [Diplodia corticola]
MIPPRRPRPGPAVGSVVSQKPATPVAKGEQSAAARVPPAPNAYGSEPAATTRTPSPDRRVLGRKDQAVPDTLRHAFTSSKQLSTGIISRALCPKHRSKGRARAPEMALNRRHRPPTGTEAAAQSGPSSSISILSPDGLQWLESRTADASLRHRLEQPLRGGASWAGWTHPLLQSLWPAENSTPVPPCDEALALVNDYFDNYNTLLPIFHPPTFMALFGTHYQPASAARASNDPAWSAAFNAVLALSQRWRAEQNPAIKHLADRAWAYAKNALEVVLALLMRSTSLLSVQALLALACFFRGTPNPQPFFFLTAAALRLSHSAGLHRAADHLPLTPVDREQRLRVFWIALILDSSASLRTGRPCTHSINDIGVPLPSPSPKDNLGILVNRRGTAVLSFLLAQAKFAVIEGKVYDRIFTASASNKTTDALDADVRDLGRELAEWSRMIPGGADCSGVVVDDWGDQHLHVASLLLAYHSCVITVHSATWQRHFSTLRSRRCARPSLDVSSGFPDAHVCLQAAREIVQLLSHVPQAKTSFIWEVVHRPVQAMMLFFICILQQPDDAEAEAHVQAIGAAVAFMSKAMTNQEDCFVQPMLTVGHELIRIARAAIQRGRERASDEIGGSRSNNGQPISSYNNPSLAAPGGDAGVPSFTPDRAGNLGPGPGPTSAPAEQSAPGSDFHEQAWSADSGFSGMDPLAEIAIPFSWNWQDLSTGLLEEFNLLF